MMKGIDVSYANGRIDWSKVRGHVDFAIIRSSFGSDVPEQEDNCFHNNAKGCVKNNIPFGIYHFAYFVNESTAKDEADFALRLARQYRENVSFIALDIEDDSVRYAKSLGKNPDWTSCAVAFLNRIKEGGFVPVLYTNQSWIKDNFDWSRLKDYKLWYAAPGADKPKYTCALWQYSWDGRIDGISGSVDRDICYDEKLFKSREASHTVKPAPEISNITSSQRVNNTVEVTSETGLNIRSGPSVEFQKLGAVPFGARLRITRQTSGGGYFWGLTEYDSIKGWVALNFTRKLNDKSIDELAREVIRGDWSSGIERERLLHQAGYDYQAVQDRVNSLLS